MYKINKKRIIKTFTELVKIPSPSWDEKELIKHITTKFKKMNIKCKKYPCNNSHNLLITIKGNQKKKPILFSAHLDTVEPCNNIKPVVTDKKITSSGDTILGSDDKSAIAMFIEAIEYIIENKMDHGPIEFLLSCAEEIGLYGVKGFDLSLLNAKYAFVFDSGGRIGKIILKAPYHSTMEIIIKGKSAHAGIEPEKGINAINIISEIITGLKWGRIDNETTANVGIISGGRATNIVAEDAKCSLEVRSISKEKLDIIEKAIKNTTNKITSKYGVKYKISRDLQYSGFTVDKNEKITTITKEALEKIKIKPEYEITGGGSDTNIFNKGKIRAINLSCGMQKVHTNKEFITINDLVKGTELVLSIIDTVD